MTLQLEIPDDVYASLGSEAARSERAALEAFALDGYENGLLSEEQLRRILGFETRYEVHGFLKAHKISMLSMEDLHDEIAAFPEDRR